MRSSLILALIAGACSLPVFAAAQDQSDGTPDPRTDKHVSRPPLKLTIKSDKSVYAPGDTITLTLTLKNPTKQPVSLTFATGQKYDVILGQLQPGKKWPAEGVWQWSRGMMFTQMVTKKTFAPGQTETYQLKYPPDDGTKPPPLTAGEYCVKGTITSMGPEPKLEATMMFKVKTPKVR
jgi:hypothetical protein